LQIQLNDLRIVNSIKARERPYPEEDKGILYHQAYVNSDE